MTERIVKFQRAYRKIEEGYGRGDVKIFFYVKGEKGAVQFALATGIYTAQDRDDERRLGGIQCFDGIRRPLSAEAAGTDLGYHSPVPMYESQKMLRDDCEVLGGPCYYDGSSLNAQDALDILSDDGEEALWDMLERYYEYKFNDGPFPEEIGRRWKRENA